MMYSPHPDLTERLVRLAQHLGAPPDVVLQRALDALVARLEDEEDDAAVVAALGNALEDDGTIDFAALRAQGTALTPETLLTSSVADEVQ